MKINALIHNLFFFFWNTSCKCINYSFSWKNYINLLCMHVQIYLLLFPLKNLSKLLDDLLAWKNLRKTKVQHKLLFSCVWHTQFMSLDIYMQCMAVKQRQNIRVFIEWDFKHWETCRQDKAQLLLILLNIQNLGLVCKYRK